MLSAKTSAVNIWENLFRLNSNFLFPRAVMIKMYNKSLYKHASLLCQSIGYDKVL
jgi:hypothetical protein